MIKLKLLSLLFFTLLFSNLSFSQIDFSTHQYFNSFSFNPAMAGVDDKKVISFFRKNISSKNTIISCEFPSKLLNSNIGIIVDRHYDESSFPGNSTKNKFGLAYNYNIPFSDFAKLRLGFQFNHIAATYDNFSTNIQHAQWFTANDFSIGAAIIGNNFKFGLGILNLLNSRIEGKSSRYPLIEEKRNIIFTFSYDVILNQKLKIVPSILINLEKVNFLVSDFSLYFIIKEKIFFGAAFRRGINYRNKTINDGIALIGFNIRKKLNFQFSINPKQESEASFQFLTQYKF